MVKHLNEWLGDQLIHRVAQLNEMLHKKSVFLSALSSAASPVLNVGAILRSGPACRVVCPLWVWMRQDRGDCGLLLLEVAGLLLATDKQAEQPDRRPAH